MTHPPMQQCLDMQFLGESGACGPPKGPANCQHGEIRERRQNSRSSAAVFLFSVGKTITRNSCWGRPVVPEGAVTWVTVIHLKVSFLLAD